MYFALMLLTLFVACSFGAMASSNYDPTDFKPARQLPEQKCFMYSNKPYCGDTWEDAYNEVAPVHIAITIAQTTCGERCSYSYETIVNGPDRWTYNVTQTVTGTDGKVLSTNKFSQQWSPTNPHTQPSGKWKCPPQEKDAPPEQVAILSKYVIGAFKVDGQYRCYRPKPNSCFESDDFKIANQYHFDPVSQGKGQVCVKNDKAENCPWKELPGSNGVFQPDIDNKSACDVTPPPPLSDPADKPKDPEKCVPGGNGMKVCKADPNEKCAVNSSGAMSCPDSCGYFNGEFMCFTEPDIPDDPNMPDKKPVPKPDDNITDPFKKMADMNKQDLKEIQRGVESRLEGFNASMDNALGELAAQGKNAEKAAGVGNKLLNSINQNTADTVKELKKLTGDESNPQPNYEETELGEKNDWQVRNFGTVMKAAGDKIMEKPMFQAIDGYFDVSFGGTCPTWSVSVWVFEVEINQFCDQSFQAVLPLIRNLVILIFSFLAFRVAFL